MSSDDAADASQAIRVQVGREKVWSGHEVGRLLTFTGAEGAGGHTIRNTSLPNFAAVGP